MRNRFLLLIRITPMPHEEIVAHLTEEDNGCMEAVDDSDQNSTGLATQPEDEGVGMFKSHQVFRILPSYMSYLKFEEGRLIREACSMELNREVSHC